MSYDAIAQFAQTWGLFYFMALFAGVVAYALWPGNKKRFDKAARMPLDEERDDAT